MHSKQSSHRALKKSKKKHKKKSKNKSATKNKVSFNNKRAKKASKRTSRYESRMRGIKYDHYRGLRKQVANLFTFLDTPNILNTATYYPFKDMIDIEAIITQVREERDLQQLIDINAKLKDYLKTHNRTANEVTISFERLQEAVQSQINNIAKRKADEIINDLRNANEWDNAKINKTIDEYYVRKPEYFFLEVLEALKSKLSQVNNVDMNHPIKHFEEIIAQKIIVKNRM